jgi:hypothetical protein
MDGRVGGEEGCLTSDAQSGRCALVQDMTSLVQDLSESTVRNCATYLPRRTCGLTAPDIGRHIDDLRK